MHQLSYSIKTPFPAPNKQSIKSSLFCSQGRLHKTSTQHKRQFRWSILTCCCSILLLFIYTQKLHSSEEQQFCHTTCKMRSNWCHHSTKKTLPWSLNEIHTWCPFGVQCALQSVFTWSAYFYKIDFIADSSDKIIHTSFYRPLHLLQFTYIRHYVFSCSSTHNPWQICVFSHISSNLCERFFHTFPQYLLSWRAPPLLHELPPNFDLLEQVKDSIHHESFQTDHWSPPKPLEPPPYPPPLPPNAAAGLAP